MIFSYELIIIVAILLLNLIFICIQKNRLSACVNVAITVILLILLLSFVAKSQIVFRDVSYSLLILMLASALIIVKQNKIVKNKKSVKKNSFSFGYFLLVTIAIIGVFLSLSYLLVADFKHDDAVSVVEAVEKLDINNTKLAREKYQAKSSLFDGREFDIKLFKGFSDIIIFICCFFPLFFAITANKQTKNNK